MVSFCGLLANWEKFFTPTKMTYLDPLIKKGSEVTINLKRSILFTMANGRLLDGFLNVLFSD